MRAYELTIVVNPSLNEKKLTELNDKIKSVVEKGKGEVVKFDNWGKKPLQYPVQKYREGIYLFFELNLDPKEIKNVEQKVKLEEDIIRHLVVGK